MPIKDKAFVAGMPKQTNKQTNKYTYIDKYFESMNSI